MKKIFFLLTALIFYCYKGHTQWQWARHWGAISWQGYNERVNNVITDGANFYAIGAYPLKLFMPDTLYANGWNDNFIIKFDANGNKIWAKTFGGDCCGGSNSNYDGASGVFDSINKCIYLGGNYATLNGGSSIFIARMDTAGNFIWQKFVTGSGFSNKATVFAEPDGDALLTGGIEDTAYFGSTKVNPGGFFARYDKDGNLKWAEQKFSGPEKYKISIDFIEDDIIMAGLFTQNPATIDTVDLVLEGANDGFITRMDSLGKVKWIKKIGNNGTDAILGISVDGLNNIYSTGYFSDTINIDNMTMVNGNSDFLFLKLSSSGYLIWARQANSYNGSQATLGSYIYSDNSGNSYISGSFSGSALFGNFNVLTSNPNDMFLTRYDSSGNCYGVQHFGQATGRDFVIDNSGNIICSGSFKNTVNIGSNTFTAYEEFDIVIAKSDAITGIQQQNRTTNSQLLIYANPNTGKCNITVPDEFSKEENLILRIFDNSGKLIQEQTVEMYEDKVKVNLEAEAKGIYNVTLSNKKKSYAGKIVFE